jgi:hypothetical protein
MDDCLLSFLLTREAKAAWTQHSCAPVCYLVSMNGSLLGICQTYSSCYALPEQQPSIGRCLGCRQSTPPQ